LRRDSNFSFSLIGKNLCGVFLFGETRHFYFPAFTVSDLRFTIYEMRILQISSAKNFGGGERHLIDLCRGLSSGGEKVFAALRPGNGWQEKLSLLPEENIFHLSLKNSLDVFSARKLARIIREKNIEIVHAHLARDYPVAALAVRLSKKAKLVLTRHLLFPLNFPHKFVLPKDLTFIAVSKGVRGVLRKQFFLPHQQIRLVYNGVDTRHFENSNKTIERENLLRQLNLKPDTFLIGIAGEITAHKGQADFVRAASIVAKQFSDAEFLIIGQDGSPRGKYRQELEKVIAEVDLKKKIHLLGWIDNVADVFTALDVFVSASLLEPFGLVIAEAMASGCAVVATKTDGATEIIENGRTGKLVSIENPSELSRAIGELLSDDRMRQELGDNARKAAAEKFSVERMVTETVKIYHEILTKKSL